jgi:hypothetical protein
MGIVNVGGGGELELPHPVRPKYFVHATSANIMLHIINGSANLDLLPSFQRLPQKLIAYVC